MRPWHKERLENRSSFFFHRRTFYGIRFGRSPDKRIQIGVIVTRPVRWHKPLKAYWNMPKGAEQ